MAKKKQTKKTTRKKRTTKRPVSVSEKIEQDLTGRALQKIRDGQVPTSRELAALKKREAQAEEERRWHYYETIPQKHWREMSGRQAKVLKEQAERYGIPFGGSTVNLSDVVKATHDFLAANARKLAKSDLPDGIDPNDPDAAMWLGDAKPGDWLDRVRRATALQKELEYEKATKQVIPREDIHAFLLSIAASLNEAGQRLRRQFGNDAIEEINEVLDSIGEKLQRLENGSADTKS